MMKHRVIKIFLGGLIVLAVVGGGAYWQWPRTNPAVGPSPAEAAPKIAWDPASVNESIAPGETVSRSIFFTSSENLGAVVVRVVPELQPYVQVDPLAFGNISAGEIMAITLTMSAPADPIEGTIQLRSSRSPSRTFAKPLPVAISPWRSVRNDRGGYEIRYPPEFTAGTGSDGSTSFQELSADGVVQGTIVILVHENPGGMSLTEFIAQRNAEFIAGGCDELVGCALFEDPVPIVIDGRDALRFGAMGLSDTVIFIQNDQTILEVATFGASMELEKMLATMRFVP